MACNNPPNYSVLDPASVERSVFLPFESTFCKNHDDAPTTEAEQYRQRKFPARCDLTGEVSMELAKRLVYLFYTRYRTEEMWRPEYAPTIPERMRHEREVHFAELTTFSDFIRFCVRPVGNLMLESQVDRRPMFSLGIQRRSLRACEEILASHRDWLRTPDGIMHGKKPWVSLPDHLRTQYHTTGSPAWVRCQCVHLFRFINLNGGSDFQNYVEQFDTQANLGEGSHRPTIYDTLSIPFVSWQLVAQLYDRFRRRGTVNATATASTTGRPVAMLPSEAIEANESADGDGDDHRASRPSARSGYAAGTGQQRRVKLDSTLIQTMARSRKGKQKSE